MLELANLNKLRTPQDGVNYPLLSSGEEYSDIEELWEQGGEASGSSTSSLTGDAIRAHKHRGRSSARRPHSPSPSSCSVSSPSSSRPASPFKYPPPAYYRRGSGLLAAVPRSLVRLANGSAFSRRWRLIALTTAALIFLAFLKTYFLNPALRPPSYIVLPRRDYIATLNATIAAIAPPPHTRTALQAHLSDLAQDHITPASYVSANGTLVPNAVWSSDKKPAPQEWFAKWKNMGGEPHFFNDAEAEAWVVKHWNGTAVKRAWDELPRMILKADFLRYLLLLVEGGTWSDMDTVPLMPLEQWGAGAVPLFSPRRATRGSRFVGSAEDLERLEKGPIRLVVGLETDPTEWWVSLGAFVELLQLKVLARHRVLQCVQWTLHVAPSHPVLLDVTRRVLQASELGRAFDIERTREAQRSGWGWYDDPVTESLDGSDDVRNKVLANAGRAKPWMNRKMEWVWRGTGYRLGWHATSVEEWTGPAVYTDSVISYLWAVFGVRPEDLTGLQGPVRIGDVVVLPTSGFAPSQSDLPNDHSRLIHLYRGSWKG